LVIFENKMSISLSRIAGTIDAAACAAMTLHDVSFLMKATIAFIADRLGT
jgi:hypothetical protein